MTRLPFVRLAAWYVPASRTPLREWGLAAKPTAPPLHAPRRWAWVACATLVACGLLACDGNPFVRVIDPPEFQAPEQYALEAVIVPGDTSRVYVTRTSPESRALEPRFQTAVAVEVSMDGGPAVAFDERRERIPTTLGVLEVVHYAHVFTEAQLPEGTSVALRVTLADGAVLTAEAAVPRGPQSFAVAAELDPEIGGSALGSYRIGDAAGPDRYLLTGTMRAYHPERDSNRRTIPGTLDSTDGPLSFLTQTAFDIRFLGTRYLFDDAGFDGGPGVKANSVGLPIEGDSIRLTFALAAVEARGYDYLEAAQRAALQTDNLLVEPYVLPSNVTGGVGGLVVTSAPLRRDVTLRR